MADETQIKIEKLKMKLKRHVGEKLQTHLIFHINVDAKYYYTSIV